MLLGAECVCVSSLASWWVLSGWVSVCRIWQHSLKTWIDDNDKCASQMTFHLRHPYKQPSTHFHPDKSKNEMYFIIYFLLICSTSNSSLVPLFSHSTFSAHIHSCTQRERERLCLLAFAGIQFSLISFVLCVCLPCFLRMNTVCPFRWAKYLIE